ncbi:MAG: hypothetical protein QNJ32_29240 [Xenococcaceae cyanobacterium MO_167.B27]|nr:hypothetical protein [Xenococcaceae cyanobacterium MO_167.B27]
MLGNFRQVTEHSWMGIYLRILALIMAYGASVHVANVMGFGEISWGEQPITWRVGDIVYGLLDTVTAIGLWQKTAWGIFAFLSAIASQFLIYTVFINYFAFTSQQRETIYGLLGTELILLLVFFVLFFTITSFLHRRSGR